MTRASCATILNSPPLTRGISWSLRGPHAAKIRGPHTKRSSQTFALGVYRLCYLSMLKLHNRLMIPRFGFRNPSCLRSTSPAIKRIRLRALKVLVPSLVWFVCFFLKKRILKLQASLTAHWQKEFPGNYRIIKYEAPSHFTHTCSNMDMDMEAGIQFFSCYEPI